MNKTIPYATVESWLRLYMPWQSKIELLQSQLNHIPGLAQHMDLVAIYGKGGHSESVVQEAIRRVQISDELPILRMKVQLLGIALTALLKEESNFVEMKYFDRVSNNLVMDQMHLSRGAFFRLRKSVLEKMYSLLGGSTSLMWLEILD